jgi:hypothetical protein
MSEGDAVDAAADGHCDAAEAVQRAVQGGDALSDFLDHDSDVL